MGVICNGIVLYGFGLIFYGVIFLVFIDYMWNFICLFVLVEVGVIWVMIYDFIVLGEDGLIY